MGNTFSFCVENGFWMIILFKMVSFIYLSHNLVEVWNIFFFLSNLRLIAERFVGLLNAD